MEILIVIVIFSVGILAVLTLLTNSIWYFDTINMQTRATLLAKEGLDLTFHHRDSNILEWFPWNYYYDNKESYRQAWNTFKIELNKDTQKKENGADTIKYLSLELQDSQSQKEENKSDFDQKFKTFAMDIGDDGSYEYIEAQNWEKTLPNKWFARWIRFDNVKWEDGNAINEKKILKVSSHVLYKRWATTWEVVLESLIWVKDGASFEDSSEI